MLKLNLKKITILALLVLIISVTCVSAQDNETALTSEITVAGNNGSDIQDAVDHANSGDTINLGSNKTYNIEKEISITKQVTIIGDNVNVSANRAFDIQSASGTTVSGITFINTVEVPEYRGNINGVAINLRYGNNLLIKDCGFINYASGIYLNNVRDSTVDNCYFTGATTGVNPDSSDSGTKAINIMGSKNLNIINNVFDGPVLDGLSIASGSGNILAENNTFINNTYAIFYGGASTEGSKIRNNRFITCGMINTSYYSANLKRTFVVDYPNLPVISLQKASDNLEITGNEFIVKDNNMLIISEAENTAHGYPSSIGSINITDNTVKKADSNVDAKTVTFYYLNVLSSLALKPTGDIIIKNNNFSDVEGIRQFELVFSAIQSGDGDIKIPKASTETYLSAVYVKDGRVVIELSDIAGVSLKSEKVTYRINGGSDITDTTDEYGHIYINGLEGEAKITAVYKGSDRYYGSELETIVQTGSAQTATKITASQAKLTAGGKYTFTLKDANGNPLEGKEISVSFNGKIYTVKTASNGAAAFTLPAVAAGKYAVTLAFTGSSGYKGSVATSTITVQKQVTKLTVAKKTFKKSATKKVTATLKSGGKALSGKKLTLKVSGKTYKATTNKKGVATFEVKITKKGTFTATTKFSGDSAYKAKTVKSKIVVK